MAFDEVQFPTNISYRSVGGPGFNTEVIELGSGHEQRNVNWSRSRAHYDVAKGVRKKSDLDGLLSFFYARRGKARGFRYKDWSDYVATGENLGTGDGSTRTFQLRRQYQSGAQVYNRTIVKLVAGTIAVYVNAVLQADPGDYSIDGDTGLITFTVPSTPGVGLAVTADFQFDVPVRFDVDHIPVQLENLGVAEASGVTLIELKPTTTTTTTTTTTVTTTTSTVTTTTSTTSTSTTSTITTTTSTVTTTTTTSTVTTSTSTTSLTTTAA